MKKMKQWCGTLLLTSPDSKYWRLPALHPIEGTTTCSAPPVRNLLRPMCWPWWVSCSSRMLGHRPALTATEWRLHGTWRCPSSGCWLTGPWGTPGRSDRAACGVRFAGRTWECGPATSGVVSPALEALVGSCWSHLESPRAHASEDVLIHVIRLHVSGWHAPPNRDPIHWMETWLKGNCVSEKKAWEINTWIWILC